MTNPFEHEPLPPHPHFSDGVNKEINYMDSLRSTEARIDTTILQPGDLVAFKSYDDQTGGTHGLTFEVTRTEWFNLYGQPNKTIYGKLGAADLPDVITEDTEVLFNGSGMGGTAVEANTISTGLRPYFRFPYSDGTSGEITALLVDEFEVFRRNSDDELMPLDLNRAVIENSRDIPNHRRTLDYAQHILDKTGISGFDADDPTAPRLHFTDCSKPLTDDIRLYDDIKVAPGSTLTYQTRELFIQYTAGQGTGNKLEVVNPTTGGILEHSYYNYQGEDILTTEYQFIAPKAAAAALAKTSRHNAKLDANTPKVRQITSAKNNLNIHYVTLQTDLFGDDMPVYDPDATYAKDRKITAAFIVDADGTISLSKENLRFLPPGVADKLMQRVSVSSDEQGLRTLVTPKGAIPLYDQITATNRVLFNTDTPPTPPSAEQHNEAPHRTQRLRNAAKAAGRTILRRSKS